MSVSALSSAVLLPLQENVAHLGSWSCHLLRGLRRGHLGPASGWAVGGFSWESPGLGWLGTVSRLLEPTASAWPQLLSCPPFLWAELQGLKVRMARSGAGPSAPAIPALVASGGGRSRSRMSPGPLPGPGKSPPKLVCLPVATYLGAVPSSSQGSHKEIPDPCCHSSLGLSQLHTLQGLGAPAWQLWARLH